MLAFRSVFDSSNSGFVAGLALSSESFSARSFSVFSSNSRLDFASSCSLLDLSSSSICLKVYL